MQRWREMRHNARSDHDLLAVIDELLRQQELTATRINEALGVELAEHQSESNPYYRFFEATAHAGPAARGPIAVSYREPVAGPTGPRLMTVDLDETATVTIDDMIHRYGEAAISQIVPDFGPDGFVSYSFNTGPHLQLSVSRPGSASTVRSVTLTMR
jgi:hypothetical protein